MLLHCKLLGPTGINKVVILNSILFVVHIEEKGELYVLKEIMF